MIIPNNHITSEGNIRFELTHLSENKKEREKFIWDRKKYMNWIDVNPIDSKVERMECECPDFRIRRVYITPCKHLKASLDLLLQFGIRHEENTSAEHLIKQWSNNEDLGTETS